ncbi:MAG TPA: hypothetical protein VGO14_07885 [Solirubrobacteraceae bacterium]|jgi:hypothetical protein|nr:hypothetical protein [Solirubrobacteraceae bacterium]
MPEVPEGISLERHRDLRGRLRQIYARRALIGVIAVLPVLALLNVFGQRPTSTTVTGQAASLSVTAPARLRSGLIFQVRVEVIAHRDIHELEITFDRGWWESMSVNSIVPEPSKSNSQNGQVVLSYGKLEAGQKLIAWVYCQVNPTNVGERRENVAIDDSGTPLVHLHRSLTIFP